MTGTTTTTTTTTIRQKLEKLRSAISFFRFVDNWHKLPILCDLLCRIGRHDWEYKRRVKNGVELECFYCERRMRSYRDGF